MADVVGSLFFLEGGGEPDTVFDYYGAPGSCLAVGPAHEAGIVDAVGLGIDGQVFTGVYMVFARLRVKGSENGLVDGELQLVLHEAALEDGVIRCVVLDGYLTGGWKPFVIFPTVEVAVIFRNGLERDLLPYDVAASALHIAVACGCGLGADGAGTAWARTV